MFLLRLGLTLFMACPECKLTLRSLVKSVIESQSKPRSQTRKRVKKAVATYGTEPRVLSQDEIKEGGE